MAKKRVKAHSVDVCVRVMDLMMRNEVDAHEVAADGTTSTARIMHQLGATPAHLQDDCTDALLYAMGFILRNEP